MQLVVMAAVLAVAGQGAGQEAGQWAGQGCLSSCRPISVMVQVEACGRKDYIYTSRCAGQCYQEDPLYISKLTQAKQRICTGVWTDEVRRIDGCDEDIVLPVARECDCSLCNPEDTYCGRFAEDLPSCSAF